MIYLENNNDCSTFANIDFAMVLTNGESVMFDEGDPVPLEIDKNKGFCAICGSIKATRNQAEYILRELVTVKTNALDEENDLVFTESEDSPSHYLMDVDISNDSIRYELERVELQ